MTPTGSAYSGSDSKSHVAAIVLPEAAHGRLADPALLGGGAAAAHLDERLFVAGAAGATLDEAGGGAIFERDESGGTDEVRLAQPSLGHDVVVGGKAEAGPHQLGLVEAARHDPPHRKRIADLLEQEARKHRENLQADAVAELVDVFEKFR